MQPHSDPRRRLAHLKHAARRLDLGPYAPPGNEGSIAMRKASTLQASRSGIDRLEFVRRLRLDRSGPDTKLIPFAWIGADIRGREAEWAYHLSPPEIAEIEAAVRAVRARGLDIADIRRGDLPLPTLGRVLDRLRAEVLDGGPGPHDRGDRPVSRQTGNSSRQGGGDAGLTFGEPSGFPSASAPLSKGGKRRRVAGRPLCGSAPRGRISAWHTDSADGSGSPRAGRARSGLRR